MKLNVICMKLHLKQGC